MNLEQEKEKLTETLSDQYSKNVIALEEYERMLDWVNKIETGKELTAVQNMVKVETPVQETPQRLPMFTKGKTKNYETVFSYRSVTIKPTDGKAGKFSSVFGTMKVKVDSLPIGKTVLKAEAVFGTVEIHVPGNVKITSDITPVFGGVFIPDEMEHGEYDSDCPVLHIKGEAVFGSIFVKRV